MFSLRVKFMVAILAVVVTSVGLASWAVNDRILAGANKEADLQANAQSTQAATIYRERAATLQAEAEAVSLYPAVIGALNDSNPKPFLQWAKDVAALQGTAVTVMDSNGRVVARGHSSEIAGDDLRPKLEGLELALKGQRTSGAEAGDELGLSLRGFSPVIHEGKVVGAVMIADPIDDQFLRWLTGGGVGGAEAKVLPVMPTEGDGCDQLSGVSAACTVQLESPGGSPAATLSLTVPLSEIEKSKREAQQALAISSSLVGFFSLAVAWTLAHSLTRPLDRLTASAHKIASDDYNEPTGLASGKDEIGVLARAFDNMRSRVAEVTSSLKNERDVLKTVLQSTAEGIMMTDSSGQTIVSNPHWSQLLGAGEQKAESLYSSNANCNLLKFVQDKATDLIEEEEADFEQNEPFCHFRCYTAPVGHDSATPSVEDDLVAGRIFVLRDVTQETEAERMRSAFISSVSHELRSPLTSIKGYTDSLLDGGPWDEETQREFLQIVGQSADKMSALVENLLDAARAEVGTWSLEHEPVRLERILHRVEAQLKPVSPEHRIDCSVPAGIPLVYGDPVRIEQVITNLVDNAVKYSPPGSCVLVQLTHDDSSGKFIRVCVSDNGVGIPEEEQAKLFQRFYRVNNGSTKIAKGMGLGLFICKSLVEAMGGRIWVESESNSGSRFLFTLPSILHAEDYEPPAEGFVS